MIDEVSRRRLRKLAGVAHERELANALTALEVDFARWRAGTLDAFELERRVRQFHEGVARELGTLYGMAPHEAAAAAIRRGVITPEEAGPELAKKYR